MKTGIVLFLVFVVIALACLGAGVVNYFQERAFLAGSELDTGTITAYELNVRTDGKSEYCPRIEFTTKAGEPIAYRDTSDCPSQPDDSKIGQTMQVYYDPKNPQQIETKTFFTGFDGLIFGLIGFVFFLFIGLIDLVGFYLQNRRAASAVAEFRQPDALRANSVPQQAARGANAILKQDSERYQANQRAAELQRLREENAELKRMMDEERRQKGQS
jgi:hypothetical protein